jgi:hypothetical protein
MLKAEGEHTIGIHDTRRRAQERAVDQIEHSQVDAGRDGECQDRSGSRRRSGPQRSKGRDEVVPQAFDHAMNCIRRNASASSITFRRPVNPPAGDSV